EVLAVARELRGQAVDRHAADRVAGEVEIEARQRLRGLGQDRHRAVDPLRRRGSGVAQVEVVVLYVVTAVAQRREQTVADAGGTRRRTVEGVRGRRCGQRERDR